MKGRRRKDPEDVKDSFLHIRVNHNVRIVLRDIAEKNNVSVTDIVMIALSYLGINFKSYKPSKDPQFRISKPAHLDKIMTVKQIMNATVYEPEWRCDKCKHKFVPYYAQSISYCPYCGSYFVEEEK